MQNKIHLLPPDLINKIAAGEVIERPASILKELMENSIDAGATDIKITLTKSGLEKIIISDNGNGLNSEEVTSAFQQHATSKIKSIDDFNDLSTLGFRGEALASISSIASVTVHSFNGIDDPVLYKISDIESESVLGHGRDKGTTMAIQNIFLNIPVRRKFLKSENTEYKYMLDHFINIAISNPTVAFSLIKNNKKIYELKKVKSIQERIFQIFTNISYKDFIQIEFDNGSMKIYELLGKSELAKNINSYQYIFLNGRFIKNALIHKAIKEGFATAIMRNLEPAYFLFYTINPQEVDVNVHPRKLEVRFNNTGLIYSTTKNLIQKTIEKNAQSNLKTLIGQSSNTGIISGRNSDINNKKTDNTEKLPNLSFTKKASPSTLKDADTHNTSRYFSFSNDNSRNASIGFTKNILENTKQIESEIFSSSQDRTSDQALQIFNTYLVLERGDKMLVIDQHAAHERINFEKILNQYDTQKHLTAQSLLIPINIKIDRLTKEKIFSFKDFLSQIGYEFNIVQNTLVIIQIPNLIPIDKISEIFLEIIKELENTQGEGSPNWTDTKNKILASIACHSSIRAGQKLDNYVISQIISDLFLCKLPYSCPHGRPFFWELTKSEIEKKFKR